MLVAWRLVRAGIEPQRTLRVTAHAHTEIRRRQTRVILHQISVRMLQAILLTTRPLI